jgi:hypothetical protein
MWSHNYFEFSVVYSLIYYEIICDFLGIICEITCAISNLSDLYFCVDISYGAVQGFPDFPILATKLTQGLGRSPPGKLGIPDAPQIPPSGLSSLV